MANQPSQRLSPIQVPELLRHILSFLDQGTLHTRICLVSWTWYQVCRPLLAHKIVWDDSWPLEKNRRLLPHLRKGGVLHWKGDQLGINHFSVLAKELERLKEERTAQGDTAAPEEETLEAIAPLQELILESMVDTMHNISLTLYSITNLTRLCVVAHENTVRIDVLLMACPQLKRLQLEGASNPLELVLSPILPSGTSKTSTLPNPLPLWFPPTPQALESLHLVNFFLYPSTDAPRQMPPPAGSENRPLGFPHSPDLLPIAGQRVSHIPRISPSTPANIGGGERFAQAMQEYKRIHGNDTSGAGRSLAYHPDTPPVVAEWSFLARDLGTHISRPHLFPIPSVITKLELLDDPHHYRPGPPFHTFLCSATHLQVLKARSVQYLGDDLTQFREKGSQSMWACRQLRMLHLGFYWGAPPRQEGGGGDVSSSEQDDDVSRQQRLEQQSRTLFGYLSKVCPKLEELVVRADHLELSLASGLCLLSRQQRLEKLEVQVLNYGLLNGLERDNTAIVEKYQRDLDWMRLSGVSAMKAKPVAVMGKEMLSGTTSLLKTLSVGSEGTKDPEEGVSWREWGSDMGSRTYSQDDLHYRGSLEDVRQCLHSIYPVDDRENKAECWPHLRQINVEWYWNGLCEVLQRRAREYRGLLP
ncbi:hypothetical protein BG006_005388 [Podila minutissima]|uniref:F-box domain-containing protein n=1 Tax=Podila minutissima TaxID=64525 RepID=A0A9P5SMK5_9FUNG|nr:hypothetical protein BG006_005388 [Podila minutissima]